MYMAMSCMQVSSIMHMMTGKCLHVARVLQPLSSLPCGRVVQLGTLQQGFPWLSALHSPLCNAAERLGADQASCAKPAGVTCLKSVLNCSMDIEMDCMLASKAKA